MDPETAHAKQSPQDINAALNIRRKHVETHLSTLKALDFRAIPPKSDRFATFIDFKRSPYTEFALRNVMCFLGEDWGLQIFVPPKMAPWVGRIVKDWKYVHINTLRVGSYGTGQDLLNGRLREPGLWRTMRGEWQLIFNADSMLCCKNLDEYLQYDYVGAPWPDDVISPWCRVGSGGLSLRRRRAMLDVCERCNNNPWAIGPEDAFFSINLHLSPARYRLPTVATARRFCVEHLYYPRPFAMHRSWLYIDAHKIDALYAQVDYQDRLNEF